jgi:perosamine synthetase
MDANRIRERRRQNYARLGGAALPEGVVPLFHPIFVRNRAEVLVRLQAQRIEPFIFGMFHHPAMRASEFPETKRLREELLCLPVHQDLSATDLERLARAVR